MTVTTTRDNNGDGIVDQIDVIQRHVDGSSVETVTDFVAGTMTDRTILTTSADGLTRTTQQDLTGNNTIARTRSDVTVISLDGSRTETIIDTNADGSLHQKGVTTTSADGRTRTLEEDTTGAGFTNHTELTTVAADGSSTTDARDVKKDGTLVSETITSVSADGRSKTTKTDSTGTHVFDHIEDSKTNIDGSTITNATDYNADSNVKARQVTTTSADGRVKVIQIRHPEHRHVSISWKPTPPISTAPARSSRSVPTAAPTSATTTRPAGLISEVFKAGTGSAFIQTYSNGNVTQTTVTDSSGTSHSFGSGGSASLGSALGSFLGGNSIAAQLTKSTLTGILIQDGCDLSEIERSRRGIDVLSDRMAC